MAKGRYVKVNEMCSICGCDYATSMEVETGKLINDVCPECDSNLTEFEERIQDEPDYDNDYD